MEMALKFGVDVSFDNVWDWKGIQQKQVMARKPM
jgi:hypothetical protein